ncbi:class I SAM-dependent methyltransferase [Candidatus Gracilibacteria bacterium]|nr:class I SAM-dependent methyltransferase [Candidatus Gracilibacteria bacterium]
MNINKYGLTNIQPILNDNQISNFEQYIKYLPKNMTSNSEILEIGPGNGTFCVFIKNKFGIKNQNLTLLDLSSSVINLLNNQEETKLFNNILSDSIEYIENIENKFDVIIMKHVFEHLEKKYINKLIPVLIKSLKKGGTILIEVPNLGNIPNGVYMYNCDYSHYTGFTDKSIGEAFYWNSDGNISVETFNLFKKIYFNKNLFSIIKDIIALLVESISFILSYFFLRIFGNWSYGVQERSTNRVFTPLLLCTITKNKE